MKKLFLFVAVVISAISAIASDQFYVIMKDGSAESFHSDKVDSITFDNPQIANAMRFSDLMAEIDKLKKEIEVLKSNRGGGNITSPGSDSLNDYDYVDLGLPSGLKWATMNVGATTPEEYGDYFAWGEVKPKDSYDDTPYFNTNKTMSQLKSASIIDKDGNLTAKYDAASQNWGGKWRMPTRGEFMELLNNCTWTEEEDGYKVASKVNGNSIFLPYAGERFGTSSYDVGSGGSYWSSTVYESDCDYAYLLYFDWRKGTGFSGGSGGRTVRPVKK